MNRVFILYILLFTLYSNAWCPKRYDFVGTSESNIDKYINNHKYDYYFARYAPDYNFDPLLIKAIAIKESRLKHWVINDKNTNGTIDGGLMQINNATLRDYLRKGAISGVSFVDVRNPDLSVRLGTRILYDKVKKYRTLSARSISLYNGSQNCGRQQYYGNDVLWIWKVMKKRNAKLIVTDVPKYASNYAPLPNANNHFTFGMGDIIDGVGSTISGWFGNNEERKNTGMLADIYPWKVNYR